MQQKSKGGIYMTYQCPKGHQSTDSDYCSECGALIGQSNISKIELMQSSNSSKLAGSGECCPDCGTPRVLDSRFCEVCRHDFHEKKTGIAEVIVASQQPIKTVESNKLEKPQINNDVDVPAVQTTNTAQAVGYTVSEKLSVVISADLNKATSCGVETAIKPDSVDRAFPLDLEENLVGRRSNSKGIYPEIVINDPGVSHRHLMFIKQDDNSLTVLELGSSNGTELNGVPLEPGVTTHVKAGDELTLGIWTKLTLVAR
jgi:hypothetical protein